MSKRYLLPTIISILFFIFCFGFSWADKTLEGPYDPKEGLEAYKKQTKSDVYHISDNKLKDFYGQCTWFCHAVTSEIMPLGNASSWYQDFKDKYPTRVGPDPRVGAICVWDKNFDGNYGHVAKVTKIYPDKTFEVWDSNYVSSKDTGSKITHRLIEDRTYILGFIYPLESGKLQEIRVITSECHPKENCQIDSGGKAWITICGKISKREIDKNMHVGSKTGSNYKSYDVVYSKDGTKTIIVFSGLWLPADEVTIKLDKELSDNLGNHMPSDYFLNFSIKGKLLVSTGPSVNYSQYHLSRSISFNHVDSNLRTVYVSDRKIYVPCGAGSSSRLVILDLDGNIIEDMRMIGEYLLEYPYQVGVDKENVFVLCDCKNLRNNRQQKCIFLIKNYLFALPEIIGSGKGENPGQFYTWNLPNIKFDSSGNMYLSDFCQGFGRIQKFSPEGNFIKQITNKDLGNFFVVKILFCRGNEIYVKADTNGCGGTAIFIFDTNLNLKKICPNNFNDPDSGKMMMGSTLVEACTDDAQNMYFVYHKGLLIKYDKNFKLICLFKLNGCPTKIQVDHDNKIYIFYHNENKLEIWDPIR